MHFRLVHLLLAAVVFACPLVCQFGRMAPAAAKSSCSCCHKKCAKDADRAGQRSTSQTPSTPDKPCKCCTQCLCGGCIVVPAVQLDIDQYCVAMAEPASDATGHLGEAASQRFENHVAESPGGENVGRRMRCWLSSLVC